MKSARHCFHIRSLPLQTNSNSPRKAGVVAALGFAVCLFFIFSATAFGQEIYRAARVEARAPIETAASAKRAGFTHLVVRLPYFRGADDQEAKNLLLAWSDACRENQIELVPQWPVCGPTELIFADPLFPIEPCGSIGGGEVPLKPSLGQEDYWDGALFSKIKTLLEDSRITFTGVCVDLTCTIDQDAYTDNDAYGDEFLSTFPPFIDLQLTRQKLVERIGIAGLEDSYRRHVIDTAASLFQQRLQNLGDAASRLHFIIDNYRHNRLYQGVAQGLSTQNHPTRCFVRDTERHFGKTKRLEELKQNAELNEKLRFHPRFRLGDFMASEMPLVIHELGSGFGGYMALGYENTLENLEDLVPQQLPKVSNKALEEVLASAQSANEAVPTGNLIETLRNAEESELVSVRGPLNRYPLFPGDNQLFLEIVTIDPNLPSVQLQVALVRPDLSVEEVQGTEIIFSSGGDAKAMVPITVRRGGWYQLVLTAIRPADGVILTRKVIALRALPAWDVSLDKSYYTSEGTARIRVRRHDGQPVRDMHLQASLTGDNTTREGYLSRAGDPASGYILIDISTLPVGSYTVKVSGAEISEDPSAYFLSLKKLPPHPCEIKFLNHRDGLLEVNGMPQFPIGVIGMGEDDFDSLAALGVNTAVAYFSAPEDLIRLAETGNRSGIGMGVKAFDVPTFLIGDRNYLRQELKAFDHEAVHFYYNAESPESENVSAYAMHEVYNFIKSEDPYRPQVTDIYAHHLDYEQFAPPYVSAIDILLMSYFPLPRGPMTRFDYGMRRAIDAARGRVPVWSVPQAFDYRSWDRTNFDVRTYSPSEREMRYTCYSTIVHGGRGILFWSLDVLKRHPQMVIALKEVLGRFTTLQPILVQEDALERFTLEPFTSATDARGKWYNGKFYLFATNGDWFPSPVLFTFLDFVPASVVEWRSGRTIEPFERTEPDGRVVGGFQDEIEGAGVRLYIIEPRG